MRLLVVAALLAVTLAGCASHDLEGGGVTDGTKTMTQTCGDAATIKGNFGGVGDADIRVADGTGRTVYSNSVSGSGGESFKSEVTGLAGTWTVTVDFDGSYSGGWWVDLEC